MISAKVVPWEPDPDYFRVHVFQDGHLKLELDAYSEDSGKEAKLAILTVIDEYTEEAVDFGDDDDEEDYDE